MDQTTTDTGAAGDAPTVTATFLFTDIEGSTRLLRSLGDRYHAVLDEHNRILRDAVRACGGEVFGSAGDAIFAVFPTASAGVDAAVAAQRRLSSHVWPDGVELRVRMALHTGDAVRSRDGDYSGLDLHRLARMLSAGWGGQILMSRTTHDLVVGRSDHTLRDLGEHRLRDLAVAERLYQVLAPGLREEFPPLRSLDARPNNLPTQLTSFVGRQREIEQVCLLLDRTRLLTLTGPGGTGKTRLSLQLAATAAERFRDGVFFVALANVVEPELVPSAILAALALQDTSGRPPMASVLDHLATRELLLVLDNFEQVLPAAPVVSELLAGAPGLKVVVTSRAGLRVSGEQEYPVPPLAVPELGADVSPDALVGFEAVTLFVERAGAVKPGFQLQEDNAAAVAEIAARLDGLPLAIELAAARVKLLPPRAIATRLSDRLGLLRGGSRDLPTRQQTLRDAIAWSYDLLDATAQRLLARLSVFAGGAGLDAAEAVCAEGLDVDVLDGLGFLVDQSLLRQVEEHDEPRFTMLDTIREFAADRLVASGEADDVRRRHAGHFLDLVEAAAPHLTGRDQVTWLDRLDHEHDNLRAALVWAEDAGATATALRIVAGTWRFWQIRGYLHEGRMRAEQVLALPGVDAHPRPLADALAAAGGTAYWQGDMSASADFYQRSLDLYRDVGDRACVANALYNLAFPTGFGPGVDTAPGVALLEESLQIYRELDDRHGEAKALWGLGDLAYWSDRVDEAERLLTESLRLFRELDDAFGLGWALHLLGLVELRTGQHDRARRSFEEALRLFADARDLSAIVLVLDDFARLAEAQGRAERAVRLTAAMRRLQRATGADLAGVVEEMEKRPDHRELLDPATRDRAIAEGLAMSTEEAVDYALHG
ncbi:MAG TPA: tetratricopeptide repeat protein [Nitriliruptorales bacterium]|nr:tetratricopeptide repeat protein [Nitriliruptorales bacterium]